MVFTQSEFKSCYYVSFREERNLLVDKNGLITCGIMMVSSIGIIDLASETEDFVVGLSENVSYNKD